MYACMCVVYVIILNDSGKVMNFT